MSEEEHIGTPAFLKEETPAEAPPNPAPNPTPDATPAPPTGPSKKRKRSDNAAIAALEDKIEKDKYNQTIWLALLAAVRKEKDAEAFRSAYERYLTIFPTSPQQWIEYIEFELAEKEFRNAEILFSRSLNKVYDVDLWRLYLRYVQDSNRSADGEKSQLVIKQAFEYALDKVGIDFHSGPLWMEYIDFVSGWTATTTWKEQQKVDTLRSIYRRAVTIPLNNIEAIWQKYNTFETEVNKLIARKFLNEKSAAYMHARSCQKEWYGIAGQLDTSKLLPRGLKDSPQYYQVWKALHGWITWEQRNPLELTDAAEVFKRVLYAWRQATAMLRFYAEVWIEAANYCASFATDAASLSASTTSFATTGLELLKDGQQANPASYALGYVLAEQLERDGSYEEAVAAYDTLIGAATEEYSAEDPGSPAGQRIAVQLTVTHIHKMQLIKRAKGMPEVRMASKSVLKKPYVTYHFFASLALMEYYHGNLAFCKKVFDFGLKKFPKCKDYLLVYLKFLCLTRDDANAVSLFETYVPKLEAQDAKDIYRMFMKYQAQFSDLNLAVNLEKRYLALFPEESRLATTGLRFEFLGENPMLDELRISCAAEDLFANRRGEAGGETSGVASGGEEIKRVRTPTAPAAQMVKNDLFREKPQSVSAPTKNEFITEEVYNLLRLLPSAAAFPDPVFDSRKLVDLLKKLGTRQSA